MNGRTFNRRVLVDFLREFFGLDFWPGDVMEMASSSTTTLPHRSETRIFGHGLVHVVNGTLRRIYVRL